MQGSHVIQMHSRLVVVAKPVRVQQQQQAISCRRVLVCHAMLPCHVAPHNYGGYCTSCRGHHWLPCTPEAAMHAKELMRTLHAHGRLDFASATPDPRFDLDMLFTKGPGRMLGVLVALDQQGDSHVLKAFSGQIGETWHIPGWVGPVAGITNTSPVYVKTRRVIDRMSARLHKIEQAAGPKTHHKLPATRQMQQQLSSKTNFMQEQQQLLKRRRKRMSHGLLQKIQSSYHTSNFAGRPLSLLDVYLDYAQQYDGQLPVTRAGHFTGMPAGAGDCCAPKLLHAAVHAGLTPIGLAEVWCGSAPGTATKAKEGRPIPLDGLNPDSSRLHLQLYGMCGKCKALLGSMLCGCPCAIFDD